MSEIKLEEKTDAVVGSWEKQTNKRQKTYFILTVVLYAAAFFVCIALFVVFQKQNYDWVVAQNQKYVQDSTVQETNKIEREMKNADIDINNLAKQYANFLSFGGDTTVEERLEALYDRQVFDRIAFISTDGLDISLTGTADVSDREYYKDGMAGNSGWQYLASSRITGKPTIIFYAPVLAEGEIHGIVAGFYEQERLEQLFSYTLFNYMPTTYLLLGDGTVVASSLKEYSLENRLNWLSQKKFSGDVDFEKIQKAIADENRTAITFSFVDNQQTSVGVIVQFLESRCMVLSILPHELTAETLRHENRVISNHVFSVIFIFAAVTIASFCFFRKQRDKLKEEMNTASRSLDEVIRDEKKQISIITSLGEMYSSVYFVDLTKSEYQRIKENNAMERELPEHGGAAEGFKIYVDKFISEEYKDEVAEFLELSTFQERLEKENVISIEYQRTDTEWRRGSLVAVEKDADGKVSSALFAVQRIDLEKKKELKAKLALQEAYEAARLASNAKTTFLSNMSHDIRTPMNAIVGMTAIAAANLDNSEKVADCLKKITSSSKHLLGLINEVLDMSKIESGKVDLCEEEFNLSDLIDNLISIHQPLIREKNHTLVVKINNLEHEGVVGDSTRLQQVFTNLLSNAIKYTPENGKISVTVSEKETNKPTIGWYEVVFEDNGIGMSEEYQKNIFEPFSRAQDTRITKIQGTGLGMPIARNIIKMMNGDITVKSRLNEGTAFTVSFALKLQTEEKVDYDKFIDLPILVADDDRVACESTCLMLDSLSMKSEWVLSGREAVDKVAVRHQAKEDYYAVIIDWKMPDMDGVATAKEIRRQVGSEVPIIVISAFDWTDIEQEAREAGVNAFLSKPLFKSKVVGLFSELVENKLNGKTRSVKDELQRFDFSGKRILLVEDNEINREIVTELLSMAGLKTECAEDGKEGVAMFAAKERGYYDLIFMDIQMPVMNGYEAAKAIRALDRPDAAKIPIIAMTANAFSSDIRAAYDAGMNGHIAKPIDIKQVMKILGDTIESEN